MIRPPPSSSRTDTPFPYTTLLRIDGQRRARARPAKHIVARRPVMTLEKALERVGRLVGASMDWTILESFLPEGTNPALRKSALASSFVAALELARQGRVNIRQTGVFEPIFIRQIGRASCRDRGGPYV